MEETIYIIKYMVEQYGDQCVAYIIYKVYGEAICTDETYGMGEFISLSRAGTFHIYALYKSTTKAHFHSIPKLALYLIILIMKIFRYLPLEFGS